MLRRSFISFFSVLPFFKISSSEIDKSEDVLNNSDNLPVISKHNDILKLFDGIEWKERCDRLSFRERKVFVPKHYKRLLGNCWCYGIMALRQYRYKFLEVPGTPKLYRCEESIVEETAKPERIKFI